MGALKVMMQLALVFFCRRSGSCWLTVNRNGLCSALFKTGATREECCNTSQEVFTSTVSLAWSEGDLTPGSLFYMHLQGGVPCSRCRDSCEGVKCPENQKCMMRNGQPKCVCAPDCAAFRQRTGKSHHKGPVCGSDGRTYKSSCRLLKRSCRRSVNITIAYYGECKLSCSQIECPSKKKCLLDQNMIPHCVNCSERKCNPKSRGFLSSSPFGITLAKSVCGSDGLTYKSICDLRQAACQLGKAIPVAYRGPCKKKASCSTVRCMEGQSCLVEPETGKPRCVTCSSSRWCDSSNSTVGPLCGTDGKTYRNWCDLTQTSCSTGIVLETKHFGACSNTQN